MRLLLLTSIALVFSSSLFAQDLSKEDQKINKRITKNIALVKLEVKNPAGELLYTNAPKAIKFLGSSSAFQGKEALLEEHAISTLFPLQNVGQDENAEARTLAYFPQVLVTYDAAISKPRAALHFRVPEGAKLNALLSFSGEYGPLLVLEFLEETSEDLTYGAILEKDLNTLMDRLAAKEIGVTTDARDNSQYKWAKIGNQVWMAENLKYKAPGKSYSELMALYKKANAELETVYSYQPPPSNVKYQGWLKMHNYAREFYTEAQYVKSLNQIAPYSAYYGRYYKFYDALASCPEGWHIPSDGEWKEMEKTIGVSEGQLDLIGSISREGDGDGAKPGKDMIYDAGLMFNGRYAGSLTRNMRNDVAIKSKGENGIYWTSSKSDEVNAIMRVIGTKFDGVVRDKSGTKNYFTCRCIQNESMETITNRSPRLKELSSAIASSPSDAANYFDRSAEFLLAGESVLALNDVNKAIELDMSNAEQKLFKAQILYIKNYEANRREIAALLDTYLAAKQDNDFAYYLHSKTLLYDYSDGSLKVTDNNVRREKSVEAINKALKVDPNNPHYLSYRAKLLVVNKDYKGAVDALKKELESDPKNGKTHYLLAQIKLKYYHKKNKANGVTANQWCTQITGNCYYLTPTQIKDACGSFTKAINYGADVSPDFLSICAELKQAETLEKHRPIIHTGPRGGRYTISSGGNKVYIPR
jgi:uncharacterized protein (TIGR02145 family)